MSAQNPGGASLPILPGPVKHKDRVCGMTVTPEKAAGKAEHEGKTYYFCSKGCAEQFSDAPDKFLEVPGSAGMQDNSYTAERGAAHRFHKAESASASDEK